MRAEAAQNSPVPRAGKAQPLLALLCLLSGRRAPARLVQPLPQHVPPAAPSLPPKLRHSELQN